VLLPAAPGQATKRQSQGSARRARGNQQQRLRTPTCRTSTASGTLRHRHLQPHITAVLRGRPLRLPVAYFVNSPSRLASTPACKCCGACATSLTATFVFLLDQRPGPGLAHHLSAPSASASPRTSTLSAASGERVDVHFCEHHRIHRQVRCYDETRLQLAILTGIAAHLNRAFAFRRVSSHAHRGLRRRPHRRAPPCMTPSFITRP
jgi:hypothetical protein